MLRRIELDRLLENTVAKAIGVKPPHDHIRANRPLKKTANTHRQVRHAA